MPKRSAASRQHTQFSGAALCEGSALPRCGEMKGGIAETDTIIGMSMLKDNLKKEANKRPVPSLTIQDARFHTRQMALWLGNDVRWGGWGG